MKIVNKGWDWQFQNETWVLPSVGSEGNIEHNTTGQVLGLKRDRTKSGTRVVMESRDKPISEEQTWLIGEKDENGFFVITNPKSGFVLSNKVRRFPKSTRISTIISGD